MINDPPQPTPKTIRRLDEKGLTLCKKLFYLASSAATDPFLEGNKIRCIARLGMWDYHGRDSKWITCCANLVDYVPHVLTACYIVGRPSFVWRWTTYNWLETCHVGGRCLQVPKTLRRTAMQRTDIHKMVKLSHIWHCCSCWVGGLSYKFNNDETPDKTALSGQNQEVSVLFVTSQRSAPQNCVLKHKLP